MSDSIDLSLLREISGGDPGLEKTIFGMFAETANHCFNSMEANITDNTEWHARAHELKGASANVGAFLLSKLCQKAEAIAANKRSDILQKLKTEYDAVKSALESA
jgi:HPt (histidine-containing phosphotransfer) domain-containing protein